MNFSRIASGAPAVLSLLLFPAAASAQYSPDATLDLGMGMGSIALGQSTLSGTREIGAEETASDASPPTVHSQQGARPSQERMNQLMAQLLPEYKLRIRRDGQASADQWLGETASRLGQQDGRAARLAQ